MNKILKGNFIFTDENRNLVIKPNAYGVCENGLCYGIFDQIPIRYLTYEVLDFDDCLIIPGLCDLHLHAPQYEVRGAGMDCELLDWLNKYIFPVERKYSNLQYAKVMYSRFVSGLLASPTSRAVIFGTIFKDSTLELMKLLELSGLHTFVGKVNMDRNSPSYYMESSVATSISDTIAWLEQCNFTNTLPIITPRFVPSCSEELLHKLGELLFSYNLNVQSHLCENINEVDLVKQLHPNENSYSAIYNKYSLFGSINKSIMAHCVYCSDEEIELSKKNNVFVAHCPSANINLASGIAPIRLFLDKGVNVGLGTDIGAGHSLNLFNEMVCAIQLSKISKLKPLSIQDVFFMATRGGGSFFGKVGAFDLNFDFDALVIDDSNINLDGNFSLSQRLERLIYLSTECQLISKFVKGVRLF